jgi:hypothetical protein
MNRAQTLMALRQAIPVRQAAGRIHPTSPLVTMATKPSSVGERARRHRARMSDTMFTKLVNLVRSGASLNEALATEDASVALLENRAAAGDAAAIDAIARFKAAGVWPADASPSTAAAMTTPGMPKWAWWVGGGALALGGFLLLRKKKR